MKKLFLLAFVSLCTIQIQAQNNRFPKYEWGFQSGKTSGSAAILAMDTDGQGNVYTTGFIKDATNLEGVQKNSTQNHNKGDKLNGFVAKYNPQGRLLWHRLVEASLFVEPHYLHIDNQNNVYISGIFKGSAQFGSARLNADEQTTFLAKYNAQGQNQWAYDSKAMNVGGIFGVESMCSNTQGDLFVYGSGFCKISANGQIENPKISIGWWFFYAMKSMKIDAKGNFLFVGSIDDKQMTASIKNLDYTDAQGQRQSLDVARAKESNTIGVVVSISSSYQVNNIRLIRNIRGSFTAKAIFDNDNNAYFAVYTKEPPTDGARSQHFLHKYNEQGNYLWTKNLTSFVESITVDTRGNVYATHSRWDKVDKAYWVVFVNAYDSRGSHIWARTFPEKGANGYAWCEFRSSCGSANFMTHIDKFNNNNLYLFGEIAGNAGNFNFETSSNSFNNQRGSESDYFLVKYSTGNRGGATITTNTTTIIPEPPIGNNNQSNNNNNNNNSSNEISFVGCASGKEDISPENEKFEKEVLRLTNLERKKVGKVDLVWDESLARAARYHAADMFTDGYFEHDSYDKVNGKLTMVCPTFERIRKFGRGNAENIAINSTPASTVNAWVNSSGHYRNMTGDYKRLGVGYYKGYWVQVFGF